MECEFTGLARDGAPMLGRVAYTLSEGRVVYKA
jgi:hypothetical protein